MNIFYVGNIFHNQTKNIFYYLGEIFCDVYEPSADMMMWTIGPGDSQQLWITGWLTLVTCYNIYNVVTLHRQTMYLSYLCKMIFLPFVSWTHFVSCWCCLPRLESLMRWRRWRKCWVSFVIIKQMPGDNHRTQSCLLLTPTQCRDLKSKLVI